MMTCNRSETDVLLAQPEPTECRFEWTISEGGAGHGEWYPIEAMHWVSGWDSRHGPGTHWIIAR